MKFPEKTNVVWLLAILAVLLLAGWFLVTTLQDFFAFTTEALPEPQEVEQEEIKPAPLQTQTVIGTSVEGRPLQVHTFGTGDTHLLFVGGIHGGYEWNSVMLAYQVIDYLTVHLELVPEQVTISIIPSANPDGLFEVVGVEGRFELTDVPAGENTAGVGRFNANGVDLNRNFACKWQPQSSWRGKQVSAGSEAFSEPEAIAIRDFVLTKKPDAAIFWHSQANTVYGSECEAGVLPETLTLMNTYATAANYNAVAAFDAYPITGDVEGWLASLGIPAITVELQTHKTTEWERNLAGVKAILDYYDAKLSSSAITEEVGLEVTE